MMHRVIALLRNKLRAKKSEFICLSPVCEISQLIIHTIIKIAYKRPAARGRKVFGTLVPFGTIWRTGAGTCTTIHFSEPVWLKGVEIPGGGYSLFSIPDVDKWTIILNSNYKQNGFDLYEPEKDMIRFDVPTSKTHRFYESFSIDIDVADNNIGVIYLSWEHVQVCFSITVSLPENWDYINRLKQL